MATTKCKHTNTTEGTVYGYRHGVSVSPYTTANRAAHGGVTFTETCDACGASRQVNQNQRHIEVGPWGPATTPTPTGWGEAWANRVPQSNR